MFQWLKRKKTIEVLSTEEKIQEKVEPSWLPVLDTRENPTTDEALEELRKQSRDEIPRFPAYPFRLLKQSNVMIPYAATIEEIEIYLNKDMIHFRNGVIALAWKGNQKSFQVLCKQLQNKDYFRRKAALEYMVYHDLFMENLSVLGEVILDGHELLVKSALEKVITYEAKGLEEEVSIALACWPDYPEITNLCQKILNDYKVDYTEIQKKQQIDEQERKINNLIYENSSQTILQERMEKIAYFSTYFAIIKQYNPFLSVEEAKKIIEAFTKEGCGYAALAITLTQHFSKDLATFRYKFGYDLLKKEQYATDKLMLDFYCMLDEPGHGMTLSQMIQRYKQYCHHYNIKIEIDILEQMDRTTYLKCKEQGYVILFAGDFTMYFKKYQPIQVRGWHIMNVCDISEEGVMKIVTWGKKYTLVKKNIRKKMYFVCVRYF